MTISPEVLAAYATLLLACVAVVAIVTPIVQRNRERVRETRAALRQFRLLLHIYHRRLGLLARGPGWKAAGLLNGLDAILSEALSRDVAKAVPHSLGMTEAYLAIINAHDILVLAALQQEAQDPSAVSTWQKAVQRLSVAADLVAIERGKYDLKVMRLFPHWFKHVEMVKFYGSDVNDEELLLG